MKTQQILAVLVERAVEGAAKLCLPLGWRELLSYPLAAVSQIQSQAAAESRDLPAEQYSRDTP